MLRDRRCSHGCQGEALTKHKQLNRHDPDNGVYGDCGRTAIACILDLHPSQVPHFWDGPEDRNRDPQAERDAWLRSRGIFRIVFTLDGELSESLEYVALHYPGANYTLLGESKNHVNHVVIGQDSQIIWDPSLDDSGIIGPAKDDSLYWIELFTRNFL